MNQSILPVLLILLLVRCTYRSESEPRPQKAISLIQLSNRISLTNPDTALVIARQAFLLGQDMEDEQQMAESAKLMGKIYYQMGGFNLAIQQLNLANQLFQNLQEKKQQAEVNNLLGMVYERSGNTSQSFVYLFQALHMYEQLNNVAGKARVYGSIGHVYEKSQMYDSALWYQKKALDFSIIQSDTSDLAEIHDNLGSIYEDLGKYDDAHKHFQIALYLNEAVGNSAAAIININNVGDIYRKKRQFESALIYTRRALKMSESAGLKYQIKSACRDLSKIYDDLHLYDSAFYYLSRSYEITDEIFTERIASEIARTQGLYELEQKQQRITLLEKERRFNRSLMILSTIAASFILVLGGLILYQQRSKNNKTRKLLTAEAQLAKTALENTKLNEQKLKTELENKYLKEEQLQQELELKSKSLTKSALHMIQKNEFLHELRTKLKDIKKGDEETQKKKIKRLIKSIDYNFNIDDDWQEFEQVFQQVHSDFFVKLNQMYPDLSPSEVRLCAMIRLNLHSKDMAAIMGISNDSLRIARYRLRKKLGLSKGANLYAFIVNIG